MDVATFGEAMMMLVAQTPGALESVSGFVKRTAGAETNVAIGLARLGLKVGWVSRLGQDSVGRYLLAEMRHEGIDCAHVASDARRSTGMLFKERVTDGSDPLVEYHRRGSAASAMRPDDIDAQWLCSARHLHATGVFAAISDNCLATSRRAMALMRGAGRTISFDPNLRPALWPSRRVMCQVLNQMAFESDWVLPGLAEGEILTGADTPEGIADYYRRHGVSLVVVKLGARGAYFDSAEQGRGYVPGWRVDRVVDTVGAGDGFAAGVISAMLEGVPVERAVERAAWIGARAVQVLGDTEGLPTRGQLEQAGF
jgi:2-dehydro-3-deoxygluconokinase